MTGMAHSAQLKKDAFVRAFAECGNISAACQIAGVGRRTYYTWTEHDEEFALAVQQAREEATEHLEEIARQRAVSGDTILLIFLLKALKPEKYQDRYQIKHQGEALIPLATIRRALTEASDGQG